MEQVDLFGTYHIDRPSKVRRELEEFSGGAQVFFTEQAREAADASDWTELLSRNPAMFIAGWGLNLLWGLPGLLLTRRFDTVDSHSTKQVAQKRGLSIEPVDMKIAPQLADVSLLITLASWVWTMFIIAIFASGAAIWPRTPLVYGLPVTGSTILGMGVFFSILPVVLFARMSLSKRDDIMAQNIQEILNSNDRVKRGCLVVGHKHMDGVKHQLESSGIEVGATHKSKFLRSSL
ncbi:hypothetical protein [Salinigranum halophilum]|uniref:hypothetical protein n=1 Tax=Salinigranum halophilum TaxID=2565931 RepID=UPI00115D598F|nr:hypothetical protein [Salinigranum halophilum]